ncbi:MAG: acyltransferase [Marinilabiliales bacterium]|nr:MAG: acyltransferase [Marinilabiliales bacterium]
MFFKLLQNYNILFLYLCKKTNMALSRSRQWWIFIRIPRILFAKFLLWAMGWKYNYKIDRNVKQAIITVAPHTSNWDFILGRICYNALDIRVRFLIKKESFIFPFSIILRMWGGLPVDRKNPGNLKEMLAKKFDRYEEFMLGITPEGTRKPNPRWKKGFYKIAMDANVPLALTYLDYKKKYAEVGKLVYPTGDYSADMKIIDEHFAQVTPKNPKGYVRPKY